MSVGLSALDAPSAAQLSNASANSAQFELKGGYYVLSVIGTGFGSVEVQKLGPDGSTFLSMNTAMSRTTNGCTAATLLPPGQYKIVVTAATGVYTDLSRVPTG